MTFRTKRAGHRSWMEAQCLDEALSFSHLPGTSKQITSARLRADTCNTEASILRPFSEGNARLHQARTKRAEARVFSTVFPPPPESLGCRRGDPSTKKKEQVMSS
ncbi:unnamed protein product [Ectocarpus sp. 12 AP-2014]